METASVGARLEIIYSQSCADDLSAIFIEVRINSWRHQIALNYFKKNHAVMHDRFLAWPKYECVKNAENASRIVGRVFYRQSVHGFLKKRLRRHAVLHGEHTSIQCDVRLLEVALGDRLIRSTQIGKNKRHRQVHYSGPEL